MDIRQTCGLEMVIKSRASPEILKQITAIRINFTLEKEG